MKLYSSNKLTIILPIKERRAFTKRFFLYLCKINFPYNLIIADGSKKRIDQSILNILKTSNIHYEYYKFPEDKNYNLFLNKIFKSLTYVKTKYIMLFSDDDFPILYSLKRLIKFLDKNDSYQAAGGYLINFDLFQKKISSKNIREEEIYGNPINLSKIYNYRSCNKKNRSERLKFFLTEGRESTWHNIYRKEVVINSYKAAKNVKFYNNLFNDCLVDCLNYMAGKIKKFNIPTLLHQYHGLSEINNRPEPQLILKQKNFIKDRDVFLLFLKKKLRLDINDINSYLTIFFLKRKNKLKNSKDISNIKFIKNLFPYFLKKIFLDFYKITLNLYLYFNNFNFNFFFKKFLSGKQTHIKEELLLFINFIKIL
jgi:glycosyltransferase domain-containing protein